MADHTDILEQAILQTGAIVKGVSADQLGAPSPCEGWDARAVINHTIGAMTMFRDAIDNGSADMAAIFGADLAGDDPASSYDRAGRELLERFRRPGVLDGTVNLPFGEFPAQAGMMLVTDDIVVHGWDVAQATKQDAEFDEGLTDACFTFMREMFGPNPEMRGGSFAPEISVDDSESAIDRLVAYLGRSR